MSKEKAVYPTGSQSYGNRFEQCKSIHVLTKSVLLLSVSKPQNHNKNTDRSNMQPAQSLLSCLFCLLSERRESHTERGGGGLLQIPNIKKRLFLFQNILKRQPRTNCVVVELEASLFFNSKERVMLVWQISDPCPAANPKQIPFQAAHLHGSSLSPLLSLKSKIQAGILSASHLTEMKTHQLQHCA